jgi:hypothetical protein
MTDHSPLAAGKYCRHAAALETDVRVANRIDRSMKAVKAAGSKTNRDGVPAESGRSELGDSHDPVLPGGDLGDHRIAIGALLPDTGSKAPEAVLHPFIAGFSGRPARR